MTTTHLMEQIRSYVAANYLYTRPDYPLRPEESLLEAGIIDSMGVMELVEFLQQEFGVAIRDEEITEENLDSLASIAAFVGRKLGALQPVG